jgi:hypothetical protein
MKEIRLTPEERLSLSRFVNCFLYDALFIGESEINPYSPIYRSEGLYGLVKKKILYRRNGYGFVFTNYGANLLHLNNIPVFGSKVLQYLKYDPMYVDYLKDKLCWENISHCVGNKIADEANQCELSMFDIPSVLKDSGKKVIPGRITPLQCNYVI